MSKVIKEIKEKFLNYIDKNSVCLEIAPGSGDMVNALIDEISFIYTIDPSLVSLELENSTKLQHIQGFFDYEFLKYKIDKKINFIIFRHLLEHINTPLNFLQSVVKLLENDGIIYVEVPNFNEVVESERFYEIFNDHCGYYQRNILVNTLNAINCELIDEIYLFKEQHMGLFFRKKSERIEYKKLNFKLFDENLGKNFEKNIKALNSMLKDFENIAIYGSGAHGNTMLSFLDEPFRIKKCFDLDKRKQGLNLQNSKINIVEPSLENFKDLDCIVIAAPLYEEEILNSLREKGFKQSIILTEKKILKV